MTTIGMHHAASLSEEPNKIYRRGAVRQYQR